MGCENELEGRFKRELREREIGRELMREVEEGEWCQQEYREDAD